MKRIFAIIFCALIAVTSVVSLSGCGCSDKNIHQNNTSSSSSQEKEPSEDIIGNWGGRTDDVEVSFKDDGTCEIGGIKGTYEIDDKNTLTVTPDSENANDSPQPMVFEYYSGDINSSVPSNQWRIEKDTIYINGYHYTRKSTDNDNIENSSEISENSSSHTSSKTPENSSSQISSKTSENGSSHTSSKTPENSGSQISSKTSENTNAQTASRNSESNNSQTSSQSSENSSITSSSESSSNSATSSVTSSEEELAPGEEEKVVVIYENLDEFFDD